jgi:FAD/FMN-containing dehydrogenase
MQAEAGVNLREVVQTAAPDGWWLAVSPSTPEATLGGCAAMNVTGRNAWKCEPFGSAIQAMEVVLASGEARALTRERDEPLLRAFVGSLGLLGFITALTLQLQRFRPGLSTCGGAAGSLPGVLAVLTEEAAGNGFMEARLMGLPRPALAGIVTCASVGAAGAAAPTEQPWPDRPAGGMALVRLAGRLSRRRWGGRACSIA